MVSQWDRLLKNQGTWVGSFTQLSPQGEMLQDTPTEVALTPTDQGQGMRQEIRKYLPGQPMEETVLNYRSLGRGVLFCDTGAFSQGAIQWSPVSEFGAELGLIHGQERLRLAQVFQRQPQISTLTLIREHLQGSAPTQRPPLSVDQLVGTWIGQATTVFPDLQPEQTMTSQLVVQRPGGNGPKGPAVDHRLQQTLTFGQSPPIQTAARPQGNILQFDQGEQPVTLLLLPDGASATFPTAIQPGKPFFLEVGWLIAPNQRQRLIRTYNAQGTWVSLTLVIEQKQT
ncbi:DUF3598 family protein [Nodosilinea sp. P-1105]|nr:DUF3598 family protein [Nodosilinea sp. P-1105]NMF82149.1 DUF3598 family protein [Nodosilinea sp. P-1105]